jgi:ribosome-associated heat shock protein Hsp15
VRLDVWLWASRFFKTRSLARQAVDGGKVEIGGSAAKPARVLRVGDELSIRRGVERYVVHVAALSAQRGPATVARTLYVETPESMAARLHLAEQRRLTGAGQDHPPNRPDKHARQLLRALKKDAG